MPTVRPSGCVAGLVVAVMLCTSPLRAQDDVAKPRQYAVIELTGSLTEGPELPGLFGQSQETLAKVQKRLERAADDDRVAGVVLNINGFSLGWAGLNELQQSIQKLRAKGKRVVAWVEEADRLDYLLAASCDEVAMPESGMVLLVGLRAEVSFYKNLLDKLSIQAEAIRVGEFKSAGEPFTRSEMSPEFRKEMEELLEDRFQELAGQVAKSRKMPADQVEKLIGGGPYTAREAVANKLIDRVAYEDEIAAWLKGDGPHEVKLLKGYGKPKLDTDFSGLAGMMKMMNLMMGVEPGTRKSNAPKIAVIYANGPIMTGKGGADFLGSETIGSTSMIKAIRQAKDDSTVKAIVLRVNSPGGSALASDLIWHELESVGKPVVASMGDVAASGGYYISMGADRIFAEPGTITGSIGVIGMKISLESFYEKIGITTTVIERGGNSGVLSTLREFNATERAALQRMIKDIYAQFTNKAAAGRKMDPVKLEAMARGRIYSGRRAKELGLIDEVGTLDDAVAAARKLGGLKDDEKFDRMILPKATSPFEQLFGPIDPEASVTPVGAIAAANPWASLLQSLPPEVRTALQRHAIQPFLSGEPVLTLMPCWIDVR